VLKLVFFVSIFTSAFSCRSKSQRFEICLLKISPINPLRSVSHGEGKGKQIEATKQLLEYNKLGHDTEKQGNYSGLLAAAGGEKT